MTLFGLDRIFLAVGFLSLLPVSLAATATPPDGPYEKCLPHAACDVVLNKQCDINFCRTCTSTNLQAQCGGASLVPCDTQNVPGGCGNFQDATCDGDGNCINWHDIGTACIQFWCFQ